MNAFNKVKQELESFKRKKEAGQSLKANERLQNSKRELARAKIEAQTGRNRAEASKLKTEARGNSFFGRIAKNFKDKSSSKGKKRVINFSGNNSPGNNVFTGSSGGLNPIYQGNTGNRGIQTCGFHW